MRKNLLIIAAIATTVLAGCSSDDFVGEDTITDPTNQVPINFGSYFKAMTRADVTGADAAALLGNKFVVSGYKGSQTTWNASDNSIVFDNYLVEWDENTANTTESNTNNWEYVGKGRIQHAIDHGVTAQTIKYWDYSKPQYDFIAWSTGNKTAIFSEPSTGIPAGSVLVSAITPSTIGTQAYTFTGSAADLANCYIADIVTAKKSADYNKPVTFRFRQLGTKVRIGIYETVPGYSVKDVKFYSGAAVALADDATDANAKIFSTVENGIFQQGTYTITFPTVDNATSADNNQAHVTFAPKSGAAQEKVVNWGGLTYTTKEDGEKSTGNVYLGRTSNKASFAGNAANNYYVVYLPNESGTNLNLRVNYTLESTDGSGEVIEVKGATAQVPSIYTQWKPGFAYTYLFKISDKTNGHTGVYDPTQPDNTTVNSDPAGLYPITFDAIVVNAEDNDQTQETITLVSTPSITTYQKGSNVVNNNEYATGNPIYVTVNDGTTASTPDLANGTLQDLTGKATLYTLSGLTGNYTEAEVIDALAVREDATGTNIKGRSGLVLTPATLELTNKVEYGVDGNAIDLTDGTKKKVAKFTPTATTTYAFVYTKTAPTSTTDCYEQVTKAAGADVTGLYRNFNLTATTGDAQTGIVYMSKSTEGILTQVNKFVGQAVTNLYTRSGDEEPYTYTSASGYAATGTTYYYTTDGGTTYKAVHPVAYADFAGATDLYTLDGTTYTAKTDAAPVDGTTYYQKTTVGTEDVYTYCVILPEQVDGLYIYQFDANGKYECEAGEKALADHGYFDKYTKNNGVYYTKIIKVQ
ncbi:MAG: hypothetical protein K6E52_01630 [Bacteroidaceae bacterium]|nr:hypothetical protein [Bacteroidaceae bacterium]